MIRLIKHYRIDQVIELEERVHHETPQTKTDWEDIGQDIAVTIEKWKQFRWLRIRQTSNANTNPSGSTRKAGAHRQQDPLTVHRLRIIINYLCKPCSTKSRNWINLEFAAVSCSQNFPESAHDPPPHLTSKWRPKTRILWHHEANWFNPFPGRCPFKSIEN